jgi:hypothetical protein
MHRAELESLRGAFSVPQIDTDLANQPFWRTVNTDTHIHAHAHAHARKRPLRQPAASRHIGVGGVIIGAIGTLGAAESDPLLHQPSSIAFRSRTGRRRTTRGASGSSWFRSWAKSIPPAIGMFTVMKRLRR